MPLEVTLTFWRTDEKLPPAEDYYYVRFSNFLTEAYWNGIRWYDPCGRFVPDFAQKYFTHWAVEPSETELENTFYPALLPLRTGSN